MYLALERENKISKILLLKKAINEKEKHIEEQKAELKMLRDECNKEQESELPILLFQIDETMPMPDDERNWNFENVYYCPDIDEIKCIVEHKREKLLPNAIDLRKDFEDFGIPKKKWPGGSYEYSDSIQNAIAILRAKINDLVISVDMNSWNDLGEHLIGLSIEKCLVKKR